MTLRSRLDLSVTLRSRPSRDFAPLMIPSIDLLSAHTHTHTHKLLPLSRSTIDLPTPTPKNFYLFPFAIMASPRRSKRINKKKKSPSKAGGTPPASTGRRGRPPLDPSTSKRKVSALSPSKKRCGHPKGLSVPSGNWQGLTLGKCGEVYKHYCTVLQLAVVYSTAKLS